MTWLDANVRTQAATNLAQLSPQPTDAAEIQIDRDREHPVGGPDNYGALPDDAVVYTDSLPASPLAEDPLYTKGEVS